MISDRSVAPYIKGADPNPGAPQMAIGEISSGSPQSSISLTCNPKDLAIDSPRGLSHDGLNPARVPL